MPTPRVYALLRARRVVVTALQAADRSYDDLHPDQQRLIDSLYDLLAMEPRGWPECERDRQVLLVAPPRGDQPRCTRCGTTSGRDRYDGLCAACADHVEAGR